jgi:hypothetical protein
MNNRTDIPSSAAASTTPGAPADALESTVCSVDFEGLLLKYMRRVIDVNGFAFVSEGVSYDGIDFTPEELAYLSAMETRARNES